MFILIWIKREAILALGFPASRFDPATTKPVTLISRRECCPKSCIAIEAFGAIRRGQIKYAVWSDIVVDLRKVFKDNFFSASQSDCRPLRNPSYHSFSILFRHLFFMVLLLSARLIIDDGHDLCP
jgi:hypothetical protein